MMPFFLPKTQLLNNQYRLYHNLILHPLIVLRHIQLYNQHHFVFESEPRLSQIFVGSGLSAMVAILLKTIVIGMKLMPGAHNAENKAMAIEELVNSYTFDKNKIKG